MRNSVLRDLVKFPSYKPKVVFDVGANVGQSVEEFVQYYPDAIIHSFEPVPASFEALEQNILRFKNVTAVNLALGSSPGRVTMQAKYTSTGNRVVTASSRGETVSVNVDTGDRYCKSKSISKIGFLKIDTEGHDLRVLAGFQGMLWEGVIDLVQLEVGLAPENKLHVPFEDATSYMRMFDYRLFRLTGINGNRRLGFDRLDLVSAYYGDAIYVRNSETLAANRDLANA
jgi:FkbM family methyltransferase